MLQQSNDARRVVSEGFSSLGADRARELGLPPRLDTAEAESVKRDIIEGHCGMLPAAMVDGMVGLPAARNAAAEPMRPQPTMPKTRLRKR